MVELHRNTLYKAELTLGTALELGARFQLSGDLRLIFRHGLGGECILSVENQFLRYVSMKKIFYLRGSDLEIKQVNEMKG